MPALCQPGAGRCRRFSQMGSVLGPCLPWEEGPNIRRGEGRCLGLIIYNNVECCLGGVPNQHSPIFAHTICVWWTPTRRTHQRATMHFCKVVCEWHDSSSQSQSITFAGGGPSIFAQQGSDQICSLTSTSEWGPTNAIYNGKQ